MHHMQHNSLINNTCCVLFLPFGSFNERVWCMAGPVSSLGLRMDNNTIRVAVGLCLGAPLCHPHTCHHCGVQVDGTATHSLSCKWSKGHHQHHAAVNDIVRTISAAHLPSRLEPTGLSCSNDKHPDRVALVPWRSGRLLVWDATCPDTFASSHLPSATREAGAVAALAEWSKQEKYIRSPQPTPHLHTGDHRDSRPFWARDFHVLRELGCRLKQVTGEAKSFSYLRRLSVVMQQGNATAAMGSMGAPPPLLISVLDCLFLFGALCASTLTACFSLICYIIRAKINNIIYLLYYIIE